MSILRHHDLLTFSIRPSPACCSAPLPQGPSLRSRMHHPLAQAKPYLSPRPKRAGQEEGSYATSGRGGRRIRRHVCMISVTLFGTSPRATWNIRLAPLERAFTIIAIYPSDSEHIEAATLHTLKDVCSEPTMQFVAIASGILRLNLILYVSSQYPAYRITPHHPHATGLAVMDTIRLAANDQTQGTYHMSAGSRNITEAPSPELPLVTSFVATCNSLNLYIRRISCPSHPNSRGGAVVSTSDLVS